MLNAHKRRALTLFLQIYTQFGLTLPFIFISFMNIICSNNGGEIFAEAELLTEAAKINGMIVPFIKLRAGDFW